MPDQWQVQVQTRHQIIMHTSHLSGADLADAHLTQTSDVSEAIAAELRAGANARLCVLPEGPQTIPYLAPAASR